VRFLLASDERDIVRHGCKILATWLRLLASELVDVCFFFIASRSSGGQQRAAGYIRQQQPAKQRQCKSKAGVYAALSTAFATFHCLPALVLLYLSSHGGTT